MSSASTDLDIYQQMRSMGVQQLRNERQAIASKLLHVQQQISDLAYGNYRIYADAGSTTERCRRMFGEACDLLDRIESELDTLDKTNAEFRKLSNNLAHEFNCLKHAESKRSPLWDVLSLPTRMEVSIRAGFYDAAYSLTNYGLQLQSHGLTKNPIIKIIAEKLINARYQLLDELFNRFAGPIDLATSIQVVNDIRKIPCLLPTQLRAAILQYRDVYLEKQLMDIKSQPDFVSRMVEVYRDCMYDTVVLYLAVFPESESSKRDLSVDPRWNVWQAVGSSAVLSEWAMHNIDCMFDHIRSAEGMTGVDIDVLSNKLMSFAMSFGRLGIDFRPLVANVISDVVNAKFAAKVKKAASKLRKCKLSLVGGEIPDAPVFIAHWKEDQPASPPALAFWDDLCVYGNDLLDAMNELRSGHSTMQINAVLSHLEGSLKSVLAWLNDYSENPQDNEQFKRAIKLFINCFVPFVNKCLLILFPYEKCCRPFYHSAVTLEQYENRCTINVNRLCADLSNAEVIRQIIADEKPPNVDTNNANNEAISAKEIFVLTEGDSQTSQSEISKDLADDFNQRIHEDKKEREAETVTTEKTEVIFTTAEDADDENNENSSAQDTTESSTKVDRSY